MREMFLSLARKVRRMIGGLWRQRCGRKETQVDERQLYVPINDEDNLDSKSAKYGSASVQLCEAPAVQNDPPTGTAKY